MNNDWSNFAEGDSGFPSKQYPFVRMTEKGWDTVQVAQETRKESIEIVELNTNAFVGKIYEIAINESNSAEARVEAFKLVWSISMDRYNYGELIGTDV